MREINLILLKYCAFIIIVSTVIHNITLKYLLDNGYSLLSLTYRYREVEWAQQPYLIGALVVLVAEQVITNKFFPLPHIVTIVVVVAIIYLITLKKNPFRFRRSDTCCQPAFKTSIKEISHAEYQERND